MKALFLVAAAFCLPVAAQTLKPGLWEVQQKMQGSGEMNQAMEEMRKNMANMPPEQRKQMEAMMAQQGVQMKPGAAGGMSMRMCMSKEMAERNEIPANQGDCKTTSQQRSGNTMRMAFTCTKPPSTGETQFTFTSPEAYTMRMTATTTAGGKSEKVNMEGTGKWLSADCGNLKPMAPAK
ncbi:MAG TPA: DUF3617 domain-containing protein [Ramlibacter sp.]|nr:DUF3617 domain-containing protein [Ramlibacter sp.]